MSINIKRKLVGLWRSRTQWAGAVLAVLVGSLPQIETYLKFKFSAEDYAFIGMGIYAVINILRWITTQPLDEKGKK